MVLLVFRFFAQNRAAHNHRRHREQENERKKGEQTGNNYKADRGLCFQSAQLCRKKHAPAQVSSCGKIQQ